jgi:hypothetical protein
MRDHAYAAFSALDPFFDIVMQGLAGPRAEAFRMFFAGADSSPLARPNRFVPTQKILRGDERH